MGDREIATKSPLAVTGASIGYSFRYYLNDMVGNQAVKMISLNGVYPDTENIKNESYPLVYQFYAVYRKDNDNQNVKKIVDWMLSPEGHDLLEQCGYTGL